MSVIRRVEFFRAESPLSRPIADSTHCIPGIGFIVTRLTVDSGVTGEAYLLAFHYSPNAISGALRDAAAMAEGWDVSRIGAFIAHYERESEYFGHAGIHRWALGSINVAMWDAWAKTLGVPVWKLLGVHRDRVPLYGSGGWLSYSIDDLLDEVTGYVRRGFRAVKIKVGSPTVAADVERIARVRETVGPGVDVMMDANQGMTVASALELATAVRPLRITWFEEPLPHTNFAGYEQLRREAGVSLAMGEREFDTVALRELIARQAIDLWQPDIFRLGGVEAWRDSAALAAAHHVPVLPHYYKEYDVPLLMTVPNAHGCESFDWVDDLITHPIRMKDGYAYPNDGPGWGFSFKPDRLVALVNEVDYAAARDICRRHAKSFYFASHFLPKDKRSHAYAVYAFCRLLDDAVDHAVDDEARMRGLVKFDETLDALYDDRLPDEPTEQDRALRAFAATVRTCGIPKRPFQELAEGCRMDLTVATYADWPSLEKYCYHVAGVVGVIMCHVFDLHDRAAHAHAIAMGNAMQLTNILRDVKEDLALGRVYLPQSDLARFGVTADGLAGGRVDDAFVNLMRFEIARARGLYFNGAQGLAMIPNDGSRYTAAVMSAVYGGILDAIERQGYDVFARRARLNGAQKIVRLVGARKLVARASRSGS